MPHPARGVLGNRIGRLRTDGRRGHSLERTVFRKCTFGAIRRGSRLAAAQAAGPGLRVRSRFVRVSGRAVRGGPRALGPPCSASSARPQVSGASPERRGGPHSTSTGSIQCTGRWASGSGGCGQTERTLPRKDSIWKMHLRRDKERLTPGGSGRKAGAPRTLAICAWTR